MNASAKQSIDVTPASPVLIAMDTPVKVGGDGKAAPEFRREYFLGAGSSLLNEGGAGFKRVEAGDVFSGGNAELFAPLEKEGADKLFVIVYPTRTYSEGFGGGIFCGLAPEDRRMIRTLQGRYRDKTVLHSVPLKGTKLFEELKGYFADDDEKTRYRKERSAPAVEKKEDVEKSRGFFEIDSQYLANAKRIFVSCMTRPNKQDYMWLATKTFGLNLAIRLVFVVKGVTGGDLPMVRAVLSTSWYQIQDAVFTVFGQTYMKFLGKMTGLVRIRNAQVGDFVFVYFQLCVFEFLNRLVLGPLGENPLVYTWMGVGLIFANILQGMLSGGPLIPAINKMRRAGVISHPMMMHFYQLSSLTMHFGLFASFGYQKFYAILTGAVLILSWSSYVFFSTYFKEIELSDLHDGDLIARFDKLAARCYSSS